MKEFLQHFCLKLTFLCLNCNKSNKNSQSISSAEYTLGVKAQFIVLYRTEVNRRRIGQEAERNNPPDTNQRQHEACPFFIRHIRHR